MTIHFIGAGPGDPDLMTLKGYKIISKCPVCLYAGSLIPKEILSHCPQNAKLIDTSHMNLDSILAEFKIASKNNLDVARLHSGDLSIWSAMGEQIRRLKEEKINFSITPGVPSFSAASAVLENEFTLPEVTQTVILTRTAGRATKMPSDESLDNMGRIGATLVIHLSIQNIENIIKKLIPYYGENCPVAIIYRASWPDQKIIKGNLLNIIDKIPKELKRTALIIVSKALFNSDFKESSLYSPYYQTRFKKSINNKEVLDE